MKINHLLLMFIIITPLNTKDISEFNNILHVRPILIEKFNFKCDNCIKTKFQVINVLKSKEGANSDTFTVSISGDHYNNYYSTNTYNILSDYLFCYNGKLKEEVEIGFFQSFNIGYHPKDILDDTSLVKISKDIDTNIKLIYLIENKDSITQELFANSIKLRGHKLNWLEYNFTKNFLDTNWFNYISLDLLKNYLDSLDSLNH